ncbi:hypothetical protein R3P38DRAFT_1889509 [Favolaschia claudopus]|uniref:Uncharacterized protein n=1 Tax=Favolaschia claudopus TaxID=2862362 RepID=A0AAW0A1T3_9AGAR
MCTSMQFQSIQLLVLHNQSILIFEMKRSSRLLAHSQFDVDLGLIHPFESFLSSDKLPWNSRIFSLSSSFSLSFSQFSGTGPSTLNKKPRSLITSTMTTTISEIHYYRFSDICSHVEPKSLQETDKQVLQSVLAHEALVEPDSPLHIDGVNGLSLFLGMSHDGHQHLLFSSAQVDCVRFWLHATAGRKSTSSDFGLHLSAFPSTSYDAVRRTLF